MMGTASALAGLELPPLYLVLRLGWTSMTLLALSSFVVPYLDRLADHGKLLGAGAKGASSSMGRKEPASSLVARALDGFLHRCTVPKRWFWHFYAASSVWTALLLWILSTGYSPAALRPPLSSPTPFPSLPALVGLALLEAQALRRLWESLCLFQYADARMHLAGYLVGFAHYGMAALTLVADPACWDEKQQQQPQVTFGLVAGTVLFVVASIEQYRCHAALAALRKPIGSSGPGARRRSGRLLAAAAAAAAGGKGEDDKSPPRTHALPRGHWGFGLVACPHYTCEALLYLALALLFAPSKWNGTAGLLALWVAANLGVTAEKTRRWYRQRFPREFPPSRVAMVPGVW